MKIIYGIFVALLFLFMAAAVLADDDDAAYMSIRADKLACKIDFHIAVLTELGTKLNNSTEISKWISKLKEDKDKLHEFASKGDDKEFHKFQRDILHDDAKSAGDSLKGIRKNFKRYNVTKDMRTSLKELFKADRINFTNCISQIDLKIAERRVEYYTKILAKRREKIEKLSKRNISVADLNDIIARAQDTIVTPLQNAVNTGDAAQAGAALKQYCLFSGCRNGTNFHFAAKFEIARLSDLLAKVSSGPKAAEIAPQAVTIQAELNSAKSALDAVGNASFGENQRDQVWNQIKAAAESFRKLIKSLKVEK